MDVTRKILKVIGWTVAVIVGLGVAVYLIAVAINWRDQEPSAAAIQIVSLYRDRPALADEANAFIYVMGFSVAPHESPYRMGLRRTRWLEESNRQGHLDPKRDPLGKRPSLRLGRFHSINDFNTACRTEVEAACITAFQSSDDVFRQWQASESWLLPRYRELIHYRGWREPVPFHLTAPLPPFGLVVDSQMLMFLDARVLAERGDYSGVRDLLEEDLAFWRRVLESSDTLISKMVATNSIKRHFELGNLVLRQIPPEHALSVMPAGWGIPISDSERSMRRCLVGEWLFTSASIRNGVLALDVPHSDSPISRAARGLMAPLYRRQDSMNRYAAYLLETNRLLSAPLDQYENAVSKAAALAKRTAEDALPPHSAYNIVGQLLTGMGANDFGPYARRVNDLEGIRRAAVLAATLRSANLAVTEIAGAVSASALREPYHNKPFEWDEKEGVITFRGLELSERSVHRVYY